MEIASVDNLAVVAGDFDPFSVTAPVDPRLPDGGGYVVSGLYNVKNEKAGQTNSYTTWSNNYGTQTQTYNGVLVNLSARTRNGVTIQGGLNTGSTVTNNCEIRGELPEIAPVNPFCKDAPGLVTRLTGLAAYTVVPGLVAKAAPNCDMWGQPIVAG